MSHSSRASVFYGFDCQISSTMRVLASLSLLSVASAFFTPGLTAPRGRSMQMLKVSVADSGLCVCLTTLMHVDVNAPLSRGGATPKDITHPNDARAHVRLRSICIVHHLYVMVPLR